jgi:uncharacterized protein YbbC (DUF1343 family)
MPEIKLSCGADRLLGEAGFRSLVKGKRVGAVVNHTAVTSDYTFWPRVLEARTGAKLEVVFTPEHGLWGQEQDQVPVEASSKGAWAVTVRSLYGSGVESLKPDPAQLSGLHVLLFDIQDVGSRYYTYIYTMAYVMEAAAEAGVRVVILDRPNPLGGEKVEGPALEPNFESFVGRFAGMPVRHGMTAAELALYFHAEHGVGEKPEVVPVAGWRRRMTVFDYPARWVGPSPNMPAPETALAYPGMCLLEGTNLSEGRGTTRPFEIFGAPYLDSFALTDELKALQLPGAIFRPHCFIPTFADYQGRLCSGAQIYVTDRNAFRPFLTGAAVIWTVSRLAPQVFGWLRRPYEFVRHIPAIDLLFGSDKFRKAIEAKCSFDELTELCEGEPEEWKKVCREHLLYD